MSVELLGRIGIVSTVVGLVAAGVLVLRDPGSGPRVAWKRHCTVLDGHARFLMLAVSGTRIATVQVVLCTVLLVVAGLAASWIPLMLALLTAFAPSVVLERRRRRRVDRIERQLSSWLLLLANSLKATPSIQEAIAHSGRLVGSPLAQELDLVVKELRLGSSLAQAIEQMVDRIGSRTVSAALSTILIGQRTGGDVPAILEESASSLREMARLESVLRTKTAEGKGQMTVIAALPFAIIGGFTAIDPDWLAPLTESFVGQIMVVCAALAWIAAILLARKILAFPT